MRIKVWRYQSEAITQRTENTLKEKGPMINNGLQNTTEKDWVMLIPLITWMNSNTLERLAVPAPLVAPIALHKHQLILKSLGNTSIHKYTQITWIKYERFTKQIGVKTNQASFICRNNSGDYNIELKTWRHLVHLFNNRNLTSIKH